MCNRVVQDEASLLGRVPDCFKTQEMCDETVRSEPYMLGHVPDHFKTQEMCEKAFEKDPRSLKHVPDWFVMDQMICQVMKQISGRHCLLENIIKWHEGYKKREAQKAQIKGEIIWHPSRWWMFLKTRKKRQKKIVEVTDSCFNKLCGMLRLRIY